RHLFAPGALVGGANGGDAEATCRLNGNNFAFGKSRGDFVLQPRVTSLRVTLGSRSIISLKPKRGCAIPPSSWTTIVSVTLGGSVFVERRRNAFRVDSPSGRLPGVVRSSQPRAGGCNPVGIEQRSINPREWSKCLDDKSTDVTFLSMNGSI